LQIFRLKLAQNPRGFAEAGFVLFFHNEHVLARSEAVAVSQSIA
jgi:hypothetical protein